jgi:hypothetical protein
MVLNGQQAALKDYKKREAQQLNAVKEAIHKLSKPQATLQTLSRPTSNVPPAWLVKSKCSWIVVNALEISAFKSDPDRKYALLM